MCIRDRSKVEPHITLYVHDNAQGAETLAAIRSLIESWKQNNSDGYYGNLRMELANVKEEDVYKRQDMRHSHWAGVRGTAF